ncbi:MAG: hypothetical protein AAF215_07250 [Cyanobacteria bacterium P01_A01_bin.123]
MTSLVSLLPGALSELFARSSTTGQITLADRYGLMAALLEDALTEEDQRVLNRLLRAICKGQIAIVDDLSNLA